jgi:Zn-dependent peptidase ImmA (M78 family)
MPSVNPDILVWARKTAGLTEEAAIERLGIKDAHGVLAIDRLRELEKGDREPSRPMLIKMTKVYRRPLVLFYMSAPPKKGNRGQDFRTLPSDYSASDDALVDALIRNILARQGVLRAAMEDEEDVTEIKFVGSLKKSASIEKALALLKQVVRIDHKVFYNQPNPNKAFSLLRSKIEAAGVFVILIGDLGSHHTEIDLEIFRGFALADELAPLIIINDHDSHAAWSFTLLHELTHIFLGQSGISGGRAEQDQEKFCNAVAGEFLLPLDEISKLKIDNYTSPEIAQEEITKFAKRRNLSSSMVAYRLYQYGAIDGSYWKQLSDFFRERWLQVRDSKQADSKEKETGPSYYQVRRHRVGVNLINLINRMMVSGALTTTKAGQVLGVKAKNVQHLIEIKL